MNGAFFRCYSLGQVTVSEGVKTLEPDAFMDCEKIEFIVLPKSLESIGIEAIDGCKSLKTVYYRGTKEEWERFSIGFDNDFLANATKYVYSEDESEGDGRYWRYADGKPEAWTKYLSAARINFQRIDAQSIRI